MKLRNKNTGEIGFLRVKLGGVFDGVEKFEVELADDGSVRLPYNSLAKLHEVWKDYEEPSYTYWIDTDGERIAQTDLPITDDCLEYNRELGLAFTTEEEAEKAVEKLKAWKRLKDKGFRFNGWYNGSKDIEWKITSLENEAYIPRQICDDLDLLFGGEE